MHEITENKKAVAKMIEICKAREIQKLVFFENICKKFSDIEVKVLGLEEKMKVLTEQEGKGEDILFEEVETIKNMLKERERKIEKEGSGESSEEEEESDQ